MTLDGQLLAFRTTWMRCIATIWSQMEAASSTEPTDSALYQKMRLDKDVKAATKNNNAGKTLALTFTPFQWPWPDTLNLFVQRFGDEPEQLRWIGDDWAWCEKNADFLLLRLPLRPKVSAKTPLDPKYFVRALADYYHQYPSIFGTVGGGGGTPRGVSLVTSAALDVADAPALSISDYLLSSSPVRFGGHAPPPGGFIASAGGFLNLEVVLVSALAKAWGNLNFADLLDSTKKQVTLTTPASALTGAALSTIRGYTSPWRLVEDDPTIQWDETSGWHDPTPHLLGLNFPEKPQSFSDLSVALASYNSTGAEFPFTCCA
jgi:hypothetical protein